MAAAPIIYVSVGTLTNGRTAYVAPEVKVWWMLFSRLVWLKLGVRLEIIQAKGAGRFSAGTHKMGDAFDWRTWRFRLRTINEVVRLAREAGAPATWYRKALQGFVPHIHAVVDIRRWTPATYQIVSVKYARTNGLARRGRDDGPRPSKWRNYIEGIVWMQNQIRIMEGGRPGLPSAGATGPTITTTTGGLSMDDIDELKKILARMEKQSIERDNYLEAQNKAIGDLIVSVPLKVWQFPVFRTVRGRRVGVKVLDEFAAMKTTLVAVAAKLGRM